MADLLLSDKYKAFLRCNALWSFWRAQLPPARLQWGCLNLSSGAPKVQSGCTSCPASIKELLKNIIAKELGILDDFGDLVEYWPGGRGENKMAHIVLHAPGGDKIIYVLGYSDAARWKKAPGGQYGCLHIDEINVADMDFCPGRPPCGATILWPRSIQMIRIADLRRIY